MRVPVNWSRSAVAVTSPLRGEVKNGCMKLSGTRSSFAFQRLWVDLRSSGGVM
jgi:hypothetical protein